MELELDHVDTGGNRLAQSADRLDVHGLEQRPALDLVRVEQEVDLDITRISGNAVTVAADFLLRDGSGNIDDPFSGFVQAVVVADTAANPQT